MATDFSKVSLGFAEFVSQLIHETFDAILDSQNYQIDRYMEIEDTLNTPNSVFRKKYISDEELNNFQNLILGFSPQKNITLTKEGIDLISSIIDSEGFAKSIKNDELTEFGVLFLKEYCLNKQIESKKSKLRTLLNHPELARISIESGEIKAKLELFCLKEDKTAPVLTEVKAIKKTELIEPIEQNVLRSNFDVKDIQIGKSVDLRVRELFDKQTQLKTLLIDKNSMSNISSNSIPAVRLVANPISTSTTTNLFSEISIKFRGI